MLVFDMIKLLVPDLKLIDTKIHLASHNGFVDPLDVFLAGSFPAWQAVQNRRNFERPFVISLIKLNQRNQWLFAGLHKVNGAGVRGTHPDFPDRQIYHYSMQEEQAASDLTGRLVAKFQRPGQQSYLNADRWLEGILLEEVYATRRTIGDFPGYRSVDLTFDELQLILDQGLASWKSALSNVAGVYLISDTESGHLYVGSASGANGIWQRWSDYALSGHGGNAELRALSNGSWPERARTFRFSILEIADIHTSKADVIAREYHWKRVLLSHSHGLNGN